MLWHARARVATSGRVDPNWPTHARGFLSGAKDHIPPICCYFRSDASNFETVTARSCLERELDVIADLSASGLQATS
jgi:hypothetical protein